MLQPLIYDLSEPGRRGVSLPSCDVPQSRLPSHLLRDDLPLPEVGEVQVARHFVNLSQLNYSIDNGFYPLGSCTMKYNPKVNEDAARLPGFAQLHPLSEADNSQGALYLMHALQEFLCEISGFDTVSLAPAAGAQAEFAGILMMRKYHEERGDSLRDIILVPNSAHGTNPATVTMAGLNVRELPSNADGDVDLDSLRAVCAGEHRGRIAGMMITMPNTLGLFESAIQQVIDAVHDAGGLMYLDGANMNAMLGIVKPSQLGFDVMHFNLHKTFSTPHGGGGPGCGAVGCVSELAAFLPGPIAAILDDDDLSDASEPATSAEAPRLILEMPENSIGRLKAFQGNFGMHLRAYAYIRSYGGEGLREVSRMALLNANYLLAKLKGAYKAPFPRHCAHEFVIEGHFDDAPQVHALDIAKRLIDFGFHPPTNYFPLTVPEALLIEPPETECKADLDAFADAMLQIADEARLSPESLLSAPQHAPVKRLDETRAARQLQLCCAAAMAS